MSLSPKLEGRGGPIPDHPYRDSVLFHGVLALVIVVLSAFSSQGVARGLVIGGGLLRRGDRVVVVAVPLADSEAQAKARAEEAEGGTGG